MSASPVQREQRRRRVLRDETPAVRTADRPQTSGQRRYSEAALAHSQPRITDFVPCRLWTLGAAFAAGALLILGLELMFSWQAHKMVPPAPPILPAFDLASTGSLGSWLASLALLLCCIVSLITYNIRRHRISDYRGRYRCWLWAALVFLVASADATAGLDQVLTGLAANITGGDTLSNHSIGLAVGWSIIGLTVAVPLLLELRISQTSTWLLLAAGLAYVGTGLLMIRVFRGSSPIAQVMLQSGLLYLAHLLLLTSLLSFARIVYLDAQGELTRKPRKVGREVQPPKWVRNLRGQLRERPTRKKAKRQAQQTKRSGKSPSQPRIVREEYDPEQEMASDAVIQQNPDLTKAERRKLRKQLKQRRQAA